MKPSLYRLNQLHLSSGRLRLPKTTLKCLSSIDRTQKACFVNISLRPKPYRRAGTEASLKRPSVVKTHCFIMFFKPSETLKIQAHVVNALQKVCSKCKHSHACFNCLTLLLYWMSCSAFHLILSWVVCVSLGLALWCRKKPVCGPTQHNSCLPLSRKCPAYNASFQRRLQEPYNAAKRLLWAKVVSLVGAGYTVAFIPSRFESDNHSSQRRKYQTPCHTVFLNARCLY